MVMESLDAFYIDVQKDYDLALLMPLGPRNLENHASMGPFNYRGFSFKREPSSYGVDNPINGMIIHRRHYDGLGLVARNFYDLGLVDVSP